MGDSAAVKEEKVEGRIQDTVNGAAVVTTDLLSSDNPHARRHRKLIDQLTACG